MMMMMMMMILLLLLLIIIIIILFINVLTQYSEINPSRSILISYSHLRLVLIRCLFPSGLPTYTV